MSIKLSTVSFSRRVGLQLAQRSGAPERGHRELVENQIAIHATSCEEFCSTAALELIQSRPHSLGTRNASQVSHEAAAPRYSHNSYTVGHLCASRTCQRLLLVTAPVSNFEIAKPKRGLASLRSFSQHGQQTLGDL